jgi:tetratricopeptide (TPR) repeat protein
MKPGYILLSMIVVLTNLQIAIAGDSVRVTTFKKVFPTYTMGPDDPNTYFKDFQIPGMAYFRGNRSVYPYTFQNDYRQEKEDVEYEVVRLENDYIYVDIIPQLRGRIQGAVDKRNNWDFLYYNHVIKPAEIAVRSAWISGGLEYNHPGGHGYTQFNKISYDIIERIDGSKTIVIAEIEPVRMMKWEFEITLYPNQLYLETKGRIISTAPFRVPFVSSNNAAIHVTDEMEIIYPQETYASGHGFSDLKKWSEYSPEGEDWNWTKSTKRVVSVFADGVGLLADYWGTYSHDEDINAGTVIVADHRVAPGKKYFSWGTSETGRQWDYFLSDEDGGYVELQQQAYFSNLGYGYAVLDPFEVKEFTIYWYPVKNTGGFVKASKEIVVNFKRTGNEMIRLDIQPTQKMEETKFSVYKNGIHIKSFTRDLQTGEVYNELLDIQSEKNDTLQLIIHDFNGREILNYLTEIKSEKPVINKLLRKNPEEYTIDQLYFRAISNYQDPYGRDAEKYIAEILKRDSMESRANRLKGTIYIKRGIYEKALDYLERSLVNDHFENSFKTWFLMGYAHLKLGDLDKAHEYLVLSGRERNELDNSLYYLAQNKILKKNYNEAIRLLKEIPLSRLTHPDIYNLMCYTSRKLENPEQAKHYLDQSFIIDPLNFVGYIELLHMEGESDELIGKINFLFDRKDKLFIGSQNYIEAAIFYMNLHDYPAALKVLDIAENNFSATGMDYPMVYYYKGFCLLKLGKKEEAMDYYTRASEADYTYVFPYRVETVPVLESALVNLPDNAITKMYLGDLLYYLRRDDEALSQWKEANALLPGNTRIMRNLAIGRYMQNADAGLAIGLLENAFQESDNDLRIFAELESLYSLQDDRIKLEEHYDQNTDILHRQGMYALNAADLYIFKKRYRDAATMLRNSYFSAAENAIGEPVRHTRYVEAQIGLGKEYLLKKEYKEAIREFSLAQEYPAFLNEARVNYPVTSREDYYLGMALKKDGQIAKAGEYFQRSIEQESNPASLAVLYQAKSLAETGKMNQAKVMVKEMLKLLQKEETGKSSALNLYLQALAYDFLGESKLSIQLYNKAFRMNYRVAVHAQFESGFLPQKKYSIE